MTNEEFSPELAAALATDPHALGTHHGEPVIKSSIAIKNAGDGLSKAMKIEPQLLEPRSTVMVLLECEVGPETYSPIPDTNCWALTQNLIAGTATIVNDQASERKLRTAANKVAQLAEQKKGVQRIPGTENAQGNGSVDPEPADDPDPEPGNVVDMKTRAMGDRPDADDS